MFTTPKTETSILPKSNAYEEAFNACNGKRWDYPHPSEWVDRRSNLAKKYAWAVPNDEALATIATYNPIIEIGAGTGYWASLLSERGVDVMAFDIAPPSLGKNDYKHSQEWYTVHMGSTEQLAQHPERTLFLCWPNYGSPFAYDALKAYGGKHFIFVGEDHGGCTGTDEFFDLLDAEWHSVKEVPIPQWMGLHDYLTIFERKNNGKVTSKSANRRKRTSTRK